MQPILFILGIRPCLEAILLLETLFNSAAPGTLSGRLRRIPVRDSVRAWDFDCALSLPSPLPAAPQNRYQILFCRSGALRVVRGDLARLTPCRPRSAISRSTVQRAT